MTPYDEVVAKRGQVIMGIYQILDVVIIAGGVMTTGRALAWLTSWLRSEERSAATLIGAISGVLIGLGLTVNGVLYLRDSYSTGLRWIPLSLIGVGLILSIAPWITSRRKARRLDSGAEGGPGLDSAPVSDLGPAIGLDFSDAKIASLIERIENVQFSTTRISPGYDEGEVDTFLDKLVAALGKDGQVNRSELRDIRFTTTRLRPGYDMAAVDTFLEEVAQATW